MFEPPEDKNLFSNAQSTASASLEGSFSLENNMTKSESSIGSSSIGASENTTYTNAFSEPVSPTTSKPVQDVAAHVYTSPKRSVFGARWIKILIAVVMIAFMVLLAVLVINHINASKKIKTVDSITNSNYAVTNVPLNNLSVTSAQNQLSQLTQVSQVTLNGSLHLNNATVLTPIDKPTNPIAGEFYYDKNSNQPYYFNGNQFISMSTPSQLVNSIDGLSGAIQLGAGLQITNGQIALSQAFPSSLVTNVQGTANQVIASGSSGSIALSLPQDISTTSSPTFAGLNLSTPLSVNNGGTGSNNSSGSRSNLGAAASGVNSDITSLTNLSNISSNSSLTIGSNTQVLSLQGSATTLSDVANSYISTLTFTVPTQNSTIIIPNTSGTICLEGSTSCGFASSSAAFIQGGNTFGATATLGTKDNQGLNLTTNGSVTESLSSSGTVIFRPTTNATNSFQVQNAAGNDNLLVGDSINTRVGIGIAAPQYTLDVAGDVNISSGSSYRINGSVVCSNIGCTPSGGSNSYVQLQALTPGNAQSGNFNISGSGIASSFSGNGIGLTNLDANQIATGTLNDLRLNANVTTQGNTFNGASQLIQSTSLNYFPALNGSLIANLNASNLTSGQVSDNLLSSNVALLNANNNFTGTNSFATNINAPGIQTTSATYPVNLGFSGTATGAVSYSLDSAATPGNYTICTSAGNCSGAGNGVTTTGGSSGYIPKFTGAQTLGNSEIIDNGSQVLINQTSGTYRLDVAGDINSTTGLRVGGNLVCTSTGCGAGSGSGYYIQNGTGLQTAANFNIRSASSSGVVAVLEGASGQTADLLDVQSYLGATKYLAVNTSGIAVSGNINATGNYQVNGTQISSTNLSDVANLAKLNGTGPQIFTGNNKFTGTLLSQNTTNSANAFEIQNAAGTSNLLIADTINNRIGIGIQPAYTLDVAGDINISSGSSYLINGVAVCGTSATCAPSSGSNNYVQNGVGVQTNTNFNIQSIATGSVVGVLQAVNGQTADILDLKNGTGIITTSIGNFGQTIFKDTSSGTATAFQIQNSSNISLLTANTLTGQILLPNATSSSTALLLGGDANLYRSAASTLKTDGNLEVVGNIDVLSGSAYMYNGSNVITAQTSLGNYFFGDSGNLTMTGDYNTASGQYALQSNTTASGNTASGSYSLYNNTTGFNNTASGQSALYYNTIGSGNTAAGAAALLHNTTGSNNTASGQSALSANTTGNYNTASGLEALVANTTGSNNTVLGVQAGYTNFSANANTTGSNNTFIGYSSGPGVASSSSLQNATAIGNLAVVDASNALVLGSINGVNGATSSVNVGIGIATPTATLDVVGTGLFQSATNSTTAFQVENAAGTDVLNINTNTGAVSAGNNILNDGAGNFTAAGNLTVNGTGNSTFAGDLSVTGAISGVSSTGNYGIRIAGGGSASCSSPNFCQNAIIQFTNNAQNSQWGEIHADPGGNIQIDPSGGTTFINSPMTVQGEVILGSASNGTIAATTTGQLTYAGTARHTKYITLTPEYAGATLSNGVWNGLSDIGTMTAGLDTTQLENYYQWSTSQSTNQAYDVAVSIPIPADFSAWASSTPITIDVKTSDITNGIVNAKLYDTAKTIETSWNTCSLTPGSANTWTTMTGCAVSGTYSNSSGKYMTLIIQLQAPNGGTTEIGNINLSYLSNF